MHNKRRGTKCVVDICNDQGYYCKEEILKPGGNIKQQWKYYTTDLFQNSINYYFVALSSDSGFMVAPGSPNC